MKPATQVEVVLYHMDKKIKSLNPDFWKQRDDLYISIDFLALSNFSDEENQQVLKYFTDQGYNITCFAWFSFIVRNEYTLRKDGKK